MLLLREQGGWKQYLFVDVKSYGKEAGLCPQILHIPQGTYLCKKVEYSDPAQVWTWSAPLVSEDSIQLVIETELFVGNYRFPTPVLEQRCLLKTY